MNKVALVIVALLLSIMLSACASKDLADVGLEGLTAKEIITGIADGSISVDGFGATVYDDELIVVTDNKSTSVVMPEDEFYLSVAPYIEFTHDCLYHSVTGCRGELKNEEFYVEFIDKDGNIIISEYMMSMSNGFIDLWLPRNIEGTLTITKEGLFTSKEISTYSGDPTCETTMQLS
jgi:hypothetical protein